MLIEIDLPEQIVSMLTTLPLSELKKRIITDNGITLAEEERIIREAAHPNVTHTLATEEDIDNYVDSLSPEVQ